MRQWPICAVQHLGCLCWVLWVLCLQLVQQLQHGLPPCQVIRAAGQDSLLAGWTMQETSSFCAFQMAIKRCGSTCMSCCQSVAMQVTHKFAMSTCWGLVRTPQVHRYKSLSATHRKGRKMQLSDDLKLVKGVSSYLKFKRGNQCCSRSHLIITTSLRRLLR